MRVPIEHQCAPPHRPELLGHHQGSTTGCGTDLRYVGRQAGLRARHLVDGGWERGSKWRKHLAIGSLSLPNEEFAQLEGAVVEAAILSSKDKHSFGLGKGRNGLVALWQRAMPKYNAEADVNTKSSEYRC